MKLTIENLGDGVQGQTTKFLKKVSQFWRAVNAWPGMIGGIVKRKGCAQKGSDLTTTTSTSSSTSTSTTTSTSTSTSTT